MRHVLSFVLVSMLVTPAVAGAVPQSKPALIPIYVTTAAIDADAANGFTSAPPKEVVSLRRHIERHAAPIKGDVLAVAASREAAAARLELGESTKQQVTGAGMVSWSQSKNEYTVRGTLIVGDFRKEFTATDGSADHALVKLGADVEKFVRDNRDKILR